MNINIDRLEKLLAKQKAEAAANRAALEGMKTEYTNQIKAGKHPDSLKDIQLKIAELATRQEGLDMAARLTSDDLEDARKLDGSPEAAKKRKQAKELLGSIDGDYGKAEKLAEDLAAVLQKIAGTEKEYNRIIKEVDGANPMIHNKKRARYYLELHINLTRWLDGRTVLTDWVNAKNTNPLPNKGKPLPKERERKLVYIGQ